MNLSNRLKNVEMKLNPPPKRKYVISLENAQLKRNLTKNFIDSVSGKFQEDIYQTFRKVIIPQFAKILEKEEQSVGENFDNFFLNTLTVEEQVDFFFECLHTDCLPPNYEYKFFSIDKMSWLNDKIGV